MDISTKLFDYLKKHIEGFTKTKKKGAYLFTCPNIANHKYKAKSPTATIINGSDKIDCFQCHWRGTIYDAVRLLEQDKKTFTDAQIMEYFVNTMKIDAYAELEEYKKYNWTLVPIARNSKNPIEKDWTNKIHYEKADWLKWLNNGLNIGVRTGEVSKVTIIDVDLKEPPSPELEEIIALLDETDTLTQNSPHGLHYIFQYDKDIHQTANMGGIHIDIRNDGGQIVIQPSTIDSLCYHWKNLGNDIKIVNENVKAKLLALNKVDNSRSTKVSEDLSTDSGVKIIKEHEGRNVALTSMGGILINKFNTTDTAFILSLISKNFFKPPLAFHEIEAMLGSLEGYKETEEQTQEKAIYECCALIQEDISALDIMQHTKLERAIIDKYLAKFHKEGKLRRRRRGRYDMKAKVEWTNEQTEKNSEYPYEIPYFSDVAYFNEGDIILVGGKTGEGKTHIAMNFIKQMKLQGVVPYYVSLESGSRHEKVANKLGLTQKDYYISKEPIDNPLQIEIEPNSFTIIDWLYTGDDFAATQSIFKYLSDEMKRKGGILVVFTQLKENYDWFAVNLVKSFARLASRFIYDSPEGKTSHFDVCKITDPKAHSLHAIVPCTFDFETKELIKKDLI